MALSYNSHGVSYSVSVVAFGDIQIEMIYGGSVIGTFKMPKAEATKIARSILNISDPFYLSPLG